MADQSTNKKSLNIRDVPLEDHAALERMRLKLGMQREPFARALLHRAIWGAPQLFENDLRMALGAEPPDLESEDQDEA